jgi:hypothetical protein
MPEPDGIVLRWLAVTSVTKKCIVRTLINEVVADLDERTSEIVLVIHWLGGDLQISSRIG